MVELPSGSAAGLDVMRGDDGVDPAADAEVAFDAHLERCHGCDEIVEDVIRHRLVEGARLAIAPEVELEGLELHAELIRHVADPDGREVGLAGLRTKARELGTLEADLVALAGRRPGLMTPAQWNYLSFAIRVSRTATKPKALIWEQL